MKKYRITYTVLGTGDAIHTVEIEASCRYSARETVIHMCTNVQIQTMEETPIETEKPMKRYVIAYTIAPTGCNQMMVERVLAPDADAAIGCFRKMFRNAHVISIKLEKTIKKFIVEVHKTNIESVDIQAESKEEAEAIVRRKIDKGEILITEDLEMEITVTEDEEYHD